MPSVTREATSCLISHPVSVTKRGSQQPNYSLSGLVSLDLTAISEAAGLHKRWPLTHRGPMSWDNRALHGCL